MSAHYESPGKRQDDGRACSFQIQGETREIVLEDLGAGLALCGQDVAAILGKAQAVAVALAAWFLEVAIDNNFARVKWQFMLKSAWAVALVGGGVNIALLAFL